MLYSLRNWSRDSRISVFPLGLEGGRRDHQHALGFAQPMQQCAGSDGLDRLAQAHLVGQERALGECEVQHAFTLIREQGHRRFLGWPLPGLDLQLVMAPEFLSFRDARAPLLPRLHVLGNAQGREFSFAQLV